MMDISQTEMRVFEPETLDVMGEAFEQAQTFAADSASPTTMVIAIFNAAGKGEINLSRLVKIGIEAGTSPYRHVDPSGPQMRIAGLVDRSP